MCRCLVAFVCMLALVGVDLSAGDRKKGVASLEGSWIAT